MTITRTKEELLQLLDSASSNLEAALSMLSDSCNNNCPDNCVEVAHAENGAEIEVEAAADEILDALRKISEYIKLAKGDKNGNSTREAAIEGGR